MMNSRHYRQGRGVIPQHRQGVTRQPSQGVIPQHRQGVTHKHGQEEESLISTGRWGHLSAQAGAFSVIKVGITCTRYVTLRNVRPWAVHSYRNTRGRGSATKHGEVDIFKESEGPAETTSGQTLLVTEGNTLPSKRPRRGKSKPESADPKSISTYDRVRVILMPWKKPEGLLNKPVFTAMINSVLLYVMSFPGTQFTSICEKYSPFLQPFCVRELLDVLEELECVEKVVFRKPPKASLFSQPMQLQEATEETLEDDSLFYEALSDCVVKLGQFLSKL